MTLRLATCHLKEAHPKLALDLLSFLKTSFCYPQRLYLMSVAHRHLKDFSHAFDLLHPCSSTHTRHNDNCIALEKGYHFMQIGDFSNAQQAFTSVSWHLTDSLPYVLAQIYLAKIFLINRQFEEALQTLSLLSPYLPQQHLLNRERLYLKGWFCLDNNIPSKPSHVSKNLHSSAEK